MNFGSTLMSVAMMLAGPSEEDPPPPETPDCSHVMERGEYEHSRAAAKEKHQAFDALVRAAIK